MFGLENFRDFNQDLSSTHLIGFVSLITYSATIIFTTFLFISLRLRVHDYYN